MHFQHVWSSWQLQQITDKLYVKEIAEKGAVFQRCSKSFLNINDIIDSSRNLPGL